MPNIVYMCIACGDMFIKRSAARVCCTPFAISKVQDMYYYPNSLSGGETPISIPVFDETKFNYTFDVRNLVYIPYTIHDYQNVII